MSWFWNTNARSTLAVLFRTPLILIPCSYLIQMFRKGIRTHPLFPQRNLVRLARP
jgi:hypothetical protein